MEIFQATTTCKPKGEPRAYADATTKNYVDLGIMNATKISRFGGIKKDAQTNLNSTCHKHKDWQHLFY